MSEPSSAVFRSSDGLELAADRYGRPKRGSVLMAHGGGQTRHAWAKTAAALAGRGWEVVTLDLRGHGDSGWSPTGDYGIERFADDLAEVTRAMGGRPALIGASLGGLAGLYAEAEIAPGGFQLDHAGRHRSEHGSERRRQGDGVHERPCRSRIW
ncbi:MAG: alpha/beta fold hydrolase [Pseudomonadota bacterium]